MPEKHYFTAREINALIPDLERLLSHAHGCTERAEELAAMSLRADEVQEQVLRSQVQFLMQAVDEDVEAITTLGGITKDVENGFVDFLGEIGGRDVWLCWRKGEKSVRYWHPIDAGYNQRRPLTPSSIGKIH